MNNLFLSMPEMPGKEVVEELIQHGSVRIERIISRGHTSPVDEWYDQSEDEWVIVLEGSARLFLEDEGEICLGKGDYLNIPAHTKHRVTWTDPDCFTIWLAVFYTSG